MNTCASARSQDRSGTAPDIRNTRLPLARRAGPPPPGAGSIPNNSGAIDRPAVGGLDRAARANPMTLAWEARSPRGPQGQRRLLLACPQKGVCPNDLAPGGVGTGSQEGTAVPSPSVPRFTFTSLAHQPLCRSTWNPSKAVFSGADVFQWRPHPAAQRDASAGTRPLLCSPVHATTLAAPALPGNVRPVPPRALPPGGGGGTPTLG